MVALLNQGLEEFRAKFLTNFPEFESFPESGDSFYVAERRYKDELRAAFDELVRPLLSKGRPTNDNDAADLTHAYHAVLTKKLPSDNKPQNLIQWQVFDWLKDNNRERSVALGYAFYDLLAGSGWSTDRLIVFIETAGTALKRSGATGANGKARLLGSCALMLLDPADFVAIRTDVFSKALEGLAGTKFPSPSDEARRVRLSVDVARQLFKTMQDEWHWAPRDLIDVQSFLWVCRGYASAEHSAVKAVASESNAGHRYWIEKTIVRGRRDRMEGDHALGKALWSPQRSKSGGDIYANMRRVEPGDIVFHLTDDEAITGVSIAAQRVDEGFEGVGGTEWGAQRSYRIALRDFETLDPPLRREDFLDREPFASALRHLAGARGGLFYNSHRGLNQGAYLTEAPEELLTVLDQAYRTVSGHGLPHVELRTASEALRPTTPYGVDEALDQVFMDRERFEEIMSIWRGKKNIVLQGAPGVGKSFIAKRLAYTLIGVKDAARVQAVQFHQSYGYEDFVQGYRPTDSGGFTRKDGVFFRFCRIAAANPNDPYVFIIDELNRGNLSKILGELMLLVEKDKRGPEWATHLTYSSEEDPAFYVPENVYLIGMMNTADRSLSLVDYALRRRFSFVTLEPAYSHPKFREHLSRVGVQEDTIDRVVAGMTDLNAAIAADKINLGTGFRIGHSFFVPDANEVSSNWHRRVVETEIQPLLEEYWFDDPAKADAWRERLLLAQ
jgi:MoxR-like ATPase